MRGTGAKGTDNPYFGALLDLPRAAPGQGYSFDTGDRRLAPYDAMREQGSDLVPIFHESIGVAVVEERAGSRSTTAQGYTIHSERGVRSGTGQTRSPPLWRGLEATDTQGQRRPILTSLLAERAERGTQLRAYRWTIEIVFGWLKRVLQVDTLLSVSPAGIAMQVAVALSAYGVLLLYHAGGPLAVRALQRRLKTELHTALFAAGVAAGERRQRRRAAAPRPAPPQLRAVG